MARIIHPITNTIKDYSFLNQYKNSTITSDEVSYFFKTYNCNALNLMYEMTKRNITFQSSDSLKSVRNTNYIFNMFFLFDPSLFKLDYEINSYGRFITPFSSIFKSFTYYINQYISFFHLVDESLYLKIKPYIKANVKVIEFDKENVLIINKDVLKMIPFKKIKLNLTLQCLLYVFDNDEWGNILFTKRDYVSNNTFFKVMDFFIYLIKSQYLKYKTVNKQIFLNVKTFIKNHWQNDFLIKTPYKMSVFKNELLSKAFSELFEKEKLIELINQATSRTPKSIGLINLGDPVYRKTELTNLEIFKSPTSSAYILGNFPNLLSTLNKNNTKHLNYWFYRYRAYNFIQNRNNKNNAEYLKHILRLIEGRRFEKRFFNEFPKLKMLLID